MVVNDSEKIYMIKAPDEKYSRYSQNKFPPYRFISGQMPHPKEHPKGYFYGLPEIEPKILNSKEWFRNEAYLFGVDLYNYAYWWESHETFESLWKKISKDETLSHFLHGLIKISAAFLKWHLKKQKGLEYLFSGGIGHLKLVCDEQEIYMGLNVMDHIAKLYNHFRIVMADPDQWPDPIQNYPFIILEDIKHLN